MNTGIVKDELPVVRKKFNQARRSGNIKQATGFAMILADLEVLESRGIEQFIVFDNGKIEGIAA